MENNLPAGGQGLPLAMPAGLQEPTPIVAPPDLIIPTGELRLRTVTQGRAVIEVDEDSELEVILPSGTEYLLPIGQCLRARWRSAVLFPSGIWSFLCIVGDEIYWLEENAVGDGWVINHNLPRLEDVSAQPQASA
jgi:hypothetical protein